LLSCGSAIPLIYKFYKDSEKYDEHPELKGKEDIQGKDISRIAEEFGDKLCIKTIEKFIENIGLSCNHLALAFIPKGGIVIVGDVIRKVEKYVMRDAFDSDKNLILKNFKASHCNTELLNNIPIFFCTQKCLGLMGAQEWVNKNSDLIDFFS